MAGRVADRQQDRFVLIAAPPPALLAPRPPVDRVVFVLLQVGAGFVGEAVCHERFPVAGGDLTTRIDAQNRMVSGDKDVSRRRHSCALYRDQSDAEDIR